MIHAKRSCFAVFCGVVAIVSLLFGQGTPDLFVSWLRTTTLAVDSQSLAVSGSLGATVKNGSTVAVGGSFRIIAWEDRNDNGRFEAASDALLGSLVQSGGIGANGTLDVQVPVAGTLLFRGNRIFVQVDSENAILESNEDNNIRNTGQNSQFVPPVGQLNAGLKWKKDQFTVLPQFNQVMMTPLVVDLEGDGQPEIIFSAFDRNDHPGGFAPGVLRAIRGTNGSEVWTVTNSSYRVLGYSGLAAGDIDGDGRVEIIGVATDRRLIAFEHDGTFKWFGPTVIPANVGTAGSAVIANLDGQGLPEIIFGATVVRSDGSLLWQGTGGIGDNGIGPQSIVLDVDLDGSLEVLAGRTCYRRDGTILWTLPTADGTPAVGNFDADPYPEIVHVTDGVVYLLEHTGQVKWGPIAIPGGGAGGPPTIADVDGDGQPEIGVAGATKYVVLETDGSVKWTTATQDASSNRTGSSVFDFEGDGTAEVVYGDEVRLRIYRGSDGIELFSHPKGSGTTHELPVIADIDRDGHADIVTAANNYYIGNETGIYVFGSTTNSWSATRSIWNQHAYDITNVNDDGSIPRVPSVNWLTPGLNNFRLNTFADSSRATAAPDLTASYIRKNDASFPASVQLTARIGNAGALPVQRPSCPATAPSGLTLTAAGRARGFCLSVFADRFPTFFNTNTGPLGIAFPATGGVLVAARLGDVRLFPSLQDGQHADAVTPVQYAWYDAVDLLVCWLPDKWRRSEFEELKIPPFRAGIFKA